MPVWLGEFGEMSVGFVDTLRNLCDQNRIGWTLWPYKKMNNNHTLMQIKEPQGWNEISGYSHKCFKTYLEKVQARPDNEISRKALAQFLENCKFENCIPSEFYFKALGIKGSVKNIMKK